MAQVPIPNVPKPTENPEKTEKKGQNKYIGVSFQMSYDQLNTGLGYINETRNDFEKTAGPQKWISDLITAHEKALTALRNYEIEHSDQTFESDILDIGHPVPVFARELDPKGFDAVMSLFDTAITGFEDYFGKHLAILYPDIVK